VYRPEYGYSFLARTTAPVDQAVQAILAAVKAADPSVPVYGAMPLAAYIGAPLETQQTAARLLALLAAIALLLAAIGLYGVVAYSVAQRSREIGIRVALGARGSDVVRAVAAHAGVLLAGGLGAGLGGAAAIGRVVSSLLFSVRTGDPVVYAAASGVMVLIALAATGIPARRATKVDPVVVLRAD
jgi:putative ABC transport system permease protein